jgi:hypothetical protein
MTKARARISTDVGYSPHNQVIFVSGAVAGGRLPAVGGVRRKHAIRAEASGEG